jgi:hypothetical protein
MTLAPLVRAALRNVDPQLGIDQVATVEDLKEESFASPRVIAALLALFAVLATVISASGIGGAALALSVTSDGSILVGKPGSRWLPGKSFPGAYPC